MGEQEQFEYIPADIGAFHDTGLVSEVNRLLLHPLGYALAVVVDTETRERIDIKLMQTDDPSGMAFGEDLLPVVEAAAQNVATQMKAAVQRRMPTEGFGIQPVTSKPALRLSVLEDVVDHVSGDDELPEAA